MTGPVAKPNYLSLLEQAGLQRKIAENLNDPVYRTANPHLVALGEQYFLDREQEFITQAYKFYVTPPATEEELALFDYIYLQPTDDTRYNVSAGEDPDYVKAGYVGDDGPDITYDDFVDDSMTFNEAFSVNNPHISPGARFSESRNQDDGGTPLLDKNGRILLDKNGRLLTVERYENSFSVSDINTKLQSITP
jgi:hypothetical protein